MTSADSFCVPVPRSALFGDKFAAGGFYLRAGPGKVAARHAHDRCAFTRERNADCLTNATARAGDNHNFVLETRHELLLIQVGRAVREP